jgi:hypothetical protein
MPNATELYGLMRLQRPIRCSADALGIEVEVSIGGVVGAILTPLPPDWSCALERPLDLPLRAPAVAAQWTCGEWGKPISFPGLTAMVEKVLLQFGVQNVSDDGTKIHAAYDEWRTSFLSLIELLAKQWRQLRSFSTNDTSDLDLFCWSAAGKAERPYQRKMPHFTLRVAPDANLLTGQVLRAICDLLSRPFDLPVEYRLQLEAYRAGGVGNNRSAIVETAAAAETALTKAIDKKLARDGIGYAKQIMDKFRTLGPRAELAKIVGVPLPAVDLAKVLIEPRNAVTHRGDFSDPAIALQAMEATDAILRLQDSELSKWI